MTLDGYESIDLAREHGGGLHVIEEIEEIRKLVETKSREIQVRESILGQSLSEFNVQVYRGQELIEALAGNLLANSEKIIEDKFKTEFSKIKKMIDRLDKKLKVYKTSASADVPPIGDMPDELQILSELLPAMTSSNGRLFAATKLAFASSHSSEKFVVKSVLDFGIEKALGYFHANFLEIANQWETNSESKFFLKKKLLLLKRLGIAGDDAPVMTVTVSLDFVGATSDDLVRGLSTNPIGGDLVLALFSNSSDQTRLGHIIKRFKKKSSLAEFVLGNENELSWMKNSDKTFGTFVLAVYFLIKLDKRGAGDKFANEFKKIEWNCNVWNKVATWRQGLWCLIQTVLDYDGSTSLHVMQILSNIAQKAASLDKSCIQPWKCVLIEKLETGRIHEHVTGPVKSLIRLL